MTIRIPNEMYTIESTKPSNLANGGTGLEISVAGGTIEASSIVFNNDGTTTFEGHYYEECVGLATCVDIAH